MWYLIIIGIQLRFFNEDNKIYWYLIKIFITYIKFPNIKKYINFDGLFFKKDFDRFHQII